MGPGLRVRDSLQGKVDAETVFSYSERADDLGTHTSKTAIISSTLPCAPLRKKSFSSNHEMARTLFLEYELQRNGFLCNSKKLFCNPSNLLGLPQRAGETA